MNRESVSRRKQARKKRREALRVSVSKIPVEVYISMIIGFLSMVSFIVVCILSAINRGNAALWVGVIPIIATVCNAGALFLAYRCFKLDDVRNKWVSIAAIMNGFMVIIYMLLYIMGLV